MDDPLMEPIIEIATASDYSYSLAPEQVTTDGEIEFGEAKPSEPILGAVVGRLAGLNDSGEPLVFVPTTSVQGPIIARTTVKLCHDDIGRDAVLMCEQGDSSKPIVIGLMEPTAPLATNLAPSVEARVDGERLVLTAHREIALHCGKASITLTADGKVLIKGAYVLSRATGTNRVRGGNVQIN